MTITSPWMDQDGPRAAAILTAIINRAPHGSLLHMGTHVHRLSHGLATVENGLVCVTTEIGMVEVSAHAVRRVEVFGYIGGVLCHPCRDIIASAPITVGDAIAVAGMHLWGSHGATSVDLPRFFEPHRPRLKRS